MHRPLHQMLLQHHCFPTMSIWSESNGAQDASATSPNAPAAPLLSDHMDMARPPHENPEYGGRPLVATSPTFATIISPGTIQWKAADQGEQAAGQQQQQQPVHAVP